MLSVAGELAEGVILGLCTPTTARSAVVQVTRAAKDRPRPQLLLSGLRVYCGPNVREARAHARRTLLGYAMVPSHRGRFVEAGLDVDAAQEAWQSGQRARALAHFPDEAVDLFCAIGRPDEVATRIEHYLAAGVDRVLVHPIGARGDDYPGALDTVYEVGRTLFRNG
jgi:alkanesulfonate monooxygenase SsuD/methylene tetrahydromethanopterin reductase-like flavin-dependent oxidoreductase (luciferase family)